ncbi:hypothetical protein C0Q70_04291 [Pomacea canaliculata]|uniref:Uncharacterized protein n=1 Tax=Pomacea canaliculata TaxID=400727 RepID=A0A2T7PV41_POMCA|nr:hypothetical protein C0Q70_04291 [Pomacea canaliculata]
MAVLVVADTRGCGLLSSCLAPLAQQVTQPPAGHPCMYTIYPRGPTQEDADRMNREWDPSDSLQCFKFVVKDHQSFWIQRCRRMTRAVDTGRNCKSTGVIVERTVKAVKLLLDSVITTGIAEAGHPGLVVS